MGGFGPHLLRRIALAGLACLATAGAAFAADLGAVPDVPMLEDNSQVELGSNWYLRGDLGYSFRNTPTATPQWASAPSLLNQDLDNSWSGGLGIGYNMGWVRADVTVDYLAGSDFKTTYSGYNCDTTGAAGTARCAGTISGEVSALPVLANLYFDLGHWSGLTPYIGGGIGVSHVEWNKVGTSEFCAANGGSCPSPHGGDDTIAFGSKDTSDWNFTWAVMAGASYAITPNLSLDIGYRFLDIADGKAVRTYTYGSGAALGSIDYKDLYMHEARVGFRYRIN